MPRRTFSSRPRLVIVDDDNDQLVLLRLAAERLGIFESVFATADTRLALENVVGHLGCVPQEAVIVLTDLKMPHVTGAEFIRRLRDHAGSGDLQIAAMSNSDYPPDVAGARAAGCALFLKKPNGFRELKEMLASLAAQCACRQAFAEVEESAQVA